MKQLNMNEVKELQMQILDYIHIFCEQNGLVYSISSGTLLGAVRHGGYIPWDDDIDIYMPRKDYEKFRVQMIDKTNGRYKFVDWSNDSSFIHSYGKVIDTNTRVDEKDSVLANNGLWVDIFPIDYVPETVIGRLSLEFLRKLLFHVISIRRTKKIRRAVHFIYFIIPVSADVAKKAYRRLLMSTGKTSNMMNLTDGGLAKINRFFPSDCFDAVIDMKFENRIYKSMIGYEKYLSSTYGDYMKLPPQNQRISHNIVAYLK